MDWEKAEQFLKEIREAYESCPPQSTWFVMIELKQLEGRYNSGERTEKLYNEIVAMFESL